MKKQTQITRDISIEDLITLYPFTRHYLSQKGIRCVACGEAVWLSLEEAACERGLDDHAIDTVVHELRLMALREENYERRSHQNYNFKNIGSSEEESADKTS
jgi:hypothetical protein